MFVYRKLPMLALAILAPACAPMGAAWTPEQSPKTVSVHVAAESFVVKLDRRGKALPKGEQEELRGFLAHLGDISNVEFSLRRTHKNLNVAVLAPVAKALVALGAEPSRIYPLAEIGLDYPAQQADVEIIAKRYVATAPACPDWSKPEAGDFSNEDSSNFGCATASALALQIADPRDLVRGRAVKNANGAHEVGGVVRYETDNVKPLTQSSSQNQSQQSSQ